MNFITGLPRSHNKTTILVVVDRLSKYVYFLAFKPTLQLHLLLRFSFQIYANYMAYHRA